MSAILQVYKSPACTASDELVIAGDDYDLMLGPSTGLDGDTGDRVDITLYIKNTGNKMAMDAQIIKDGDAEDRIAWRTSTSADFSKGILSLGDIPISNVVPIYIRLTIPRSTPASLVNPNFILRFRSLP